MRIDAIFRVLIVLSGFARRQLAHREERFSLQPTEASRDDLSPIHLRSRRSLAGMFLHFHPPLASPFCAHRSSTHGPQMVKVDPALAKHEERKQEEAYEQRPPESPTVEFLVEEGDSNKVECSVLADLETPDGTTTYNVLLPVDNAIVFGKVSRNEQGINVLTQLAEEDVTPELVSAATAACAENDIEIAHTQVVSTARMSLDDEERVKLRHGGNILIPDDEDDEEDITESDEGYILTEFQHEGLGEVAVVMNQNRHYVFARRLNAKQCVDLTEAEREDDNLIDILMELAEEADENMGSDDIDEKDLAW